jgi:Icc protein
MKIVQITDTHIRSDDTVVHWGYRPEASLAAVLAHVRVENANADLILISGDCVHAFPAEPDPAFRVSETVAAYTKLRGLVSSSVGAGVPIRAIPGNHDSRALLSEAFPESARSSDESGLPPSPPGAHCFAEELGGEWLLVGLDSQTGPAHDPLSEGGLGAVQRDWLRGCLRASAERHAIIFLHHPPLPHKGCFNAAEAADLEALLVEHAGQIKAVVAGHIHNDFTATLGGGVRESHRVPAAVLLIVEPMLVPDMCVWLSWRVIAFKFATSQRCTLRPPPSSSSTLMRPAPRCSKISAALGQDTAFWSSEPTAAW